MQQKKFPAWKSFREFLLLFCEEILALRANVAKQTDYPTQMPTYLRSYSLTTAGPHDVFVFVCESSVKLCVGEKFGAVLYSPSAQVSNVGSMVRS